tara:strand:+ start:979 stop:1458 length:480 start_codon:yes stop_codon:yes gene_type:complete
MIKAKIYKPAKNTMQSGRGKTQKWLLEYNTPISRSPESLMGWTSADSTMGQVRLRFDSLDDAKAYADKEGLAYIISPDQDRKIKPRNYVDNFKYEPPAGEKKEELKEEKTKKAPAKKKPSAKDKDADKPAPKKAATKKSPAKKTAAKKAPAKKATKDKE